MPKTKKTNEKLYFVKFINTYKLENIGEANNFIKQHLTEKIVAKDIVEAYTIANDLLAKINAVDPLQKYVIYDVDIDVF